MRRLVLAVWDTVSAALLGLLAALLWAVIDDPVGRVVVTLAVSCLGVFALTVAYRGVRAARAEEEVSTR